MDESEVIELSEWSLNELLAQASATARGVVHSRVDEKDKENNDKMIRITNRTLRILMQSAAGEEVDDVETDEDVNDVETDEDVKEEGEDSEEEYLATDPPHNRYKASKMTYSCSLIDGESDYSGDGS